MSTLASAPAIDRSKCRIGLIAGWMALFAVVLAPLPLASNSPVFWTGGATFIALLSLLACIDPTYANAVKVAPLPAITALLAAYLLFSLAQALLPIGTAIPVSTGLEVASNRISVAPVASITGTLRMAACGLLFLLLVNASRDRGVAQMMAQVLFASVTIYAGYALLALYFLGDTVLGFEKTAYQGFTTGTFINRNAFASFLGMGLCLGCALLGQANRREKIAVFQHRLMLAAIILITATLILTGSRMGMAASFAGALITLTLLSGRAAPRIVGPVLLAAAIGTTVLVTIGSPVLDRITETGLSSDGRSALYPRVIDMIVERPFYGYGVDTFEPAFRLWRGTDLNPDVIWDRAHSTYLTLWAESGILFGTIPPTIVAIIAVSCWWQSRGAPEDRILPAAAIGCTALAGLHATLDFSFEIQANLWFFTAILAIALPGRVKPEPRRPT